MACSWAGRILAVSVMPSAPDPRTGRYSGSGRGTSRISALNHSGVADVPVGEDRNGTSEKKIIATVSAAHFVSHYYILLLPPLMPAIHANLGLSYERLALLLTIFGTMTALLQTPAGMLAERMDRPRLLAGALALGAFAFLLAAALPGFPALAAGMALAGAANAVYHPVDYAILAQASHPGRLPRVFSIHTFAGFLGSAAAPVSLVAMAQWMGWRGAMAAAAVAGLLLVPMVSLLRMDSMRTKPPGPAGEPAAVSTTTALLRSPAILSNAGAWVLLSVASVGVQAFLVPAWHGLHDVPIIAGSMAVSGFMAGTAVGVLGGGELAGNAKRQQLVLIAGLLGAASLVLFSMAPLATAPLVGVMIAAGVLNGIILPSRDLRVREAVRGDAVARAFGIVSTGMSLGVMAGPMIFGPLLGSGHFHAVFLTIAGSYFLSLLLMMGPPLRRRVESGN